MIVTCDACQTRFRIPDEKVTEKGVKVRCTKCQHTFRVSRPAPAPEVAHVPPPVADAGFDPFAAFSPAPEPNSDEATRPFTLSPAAMAKLGFAPEPSPEADAEDDPFSNPTRLIPNTELPAAAKPPPLPPAPAPTRPSAPEANPFAWLDPTQPGRPAQADPFASSGPAPADPFAAPAPPAPPPRKAPAPAPVDPFAASAAHADPFGPSAPMQADPFASTQPAYPQAPQPSLDEAPAFGELSNPGFGMPSAFSESTQTGLIHNASGPDRSAFDTSGDSMDPGSLTGPFSRPMDRGMFDMPPAQPQPTGLLGDLPPATFGSDDAPEEVTATGVLPKPPPPPPAPAEVTRVAPVPSAGAADVPAERPGAFRSFGGAVVNIAAAVLLLAGVAVVAAVYLNGGRVDWASLTSEHLEHLWTRQGEVVARDVSNGLYDTKGDHAVLYVRGFVENRTGRMGKVKVTAEIYDGDQLLRPASVYAGKSPTPEELAAISGQPDLEALVAKLNQGAVEVGPGMKVPFLVPFYEYPTDLTGLRMKVTASAPEPVTAKR